MGRRRPRRRRLLRAGPGPRQGDGPAAGDRLRRRRDGRGLRPRGARGRTARRPCGSGRLQPQRGRPDRDRRRHRGSGAPGRGGQGGGPARQPTAGLGRLPHPVRRPRGRRLPRRRGALRGPPAQRHRLRQHQGRALRRRHRRQPQGPGRAAHQPGRLRRAASRRCTRPGSGSSWSSAPRACSPSWYAGSSATASTRSSASTPAPDATRTSR